MAKSAESLFELSIDEVAEMILANPKVTTLVQGHMGSGKSSILKMLASNLTNHIPCYFDCTTKDLGDLMMPKLLNAETDEGCVRFVPNEELGFHLNQPVILMIDEFGKANAAVKNGMMRVMLERSLGHKKLHPDSIIFATTNLGAEGVGDLLLPHHRDRITVVKMGKKDGDAWIEDYAINAGIHPAVILFAKEHGKQLFQSFEDVEKPDDEVGGNPYIYHPKVQRHKFVTHRGMEMASHWVWAKDKMSDNALRAALIGTLGARGGSDLAAYVKLVDDLPRQEEIKNDPKNAKIPTTSSGVVMVIYRALATMDKDWVDSWMDYLPRLDKEAQGLFAMQVRNPKYSKQSLIMKNAKFTKWCLDNNYMFVADKA